MLHAVSKTLPPANAGGRTGIGHSRKPDAQTIISEAAGRIREHFPGLRVREALESDDSPADVLMRVAAQASLLVIGCRHHARRSIQSSACRRNRTEHHSDSFGEHLDRNPAQHWTDRGRIRLHSGCGRRAPPGAGRPGSDPQRASCPPSGRTGNNDGGARQASQRGRGEVSAAVVSCTVPARTSVPLGVQRRPPVRRGIDHEAPAAHLGGCDAHQMILAPGFPR